MIASYFHKGSGLGDQLHRYITVRTLAEKKGFEWGMLNHQEFKGHGFMKLDLNPPITATPENPLYLSSWNEKEVRENGVDIRSYDPEITFLKDNTVIDGTFEDSRYWGHNLPRINEWLKVDFLHVPEDVCVIGFRGGEYATVPDLYLTHDYWETAIKMMKGQGITKFEVHTDDPQAAWGMLGDLLGADIPYVQDIGLNWRSVRYAKYAIIANSAFYIMPRILRHASAQWAHHQALTIAPRYWARRNTKTWARPACYYPEFTYV